jgi:hypothetical protein
MMMRITIGGFGTYPTQKTVERNAVKDAMLAADAINGVVFKRQEQISIAEVCFPWSTRTFCFCGEDIFG